MGNLVDIFSGDAFRLVELTDAINKVPHKPTRIGDLKLFRSKGISQTTVVVEEKNGQLSLITSSPRGGPGSSIGRNTRTARSFRVPHFERESRIMADEVQGVRAFGSTNEAEGVQAVVNERLADLSAMHDVTLEYLRVGAIKGLILDGDGSTLFNLFTEFGVSQNTYEIDLTGTDEDYRLRSHCVAIQRSIENEVGAETISSFRALCGDDFFDLLIDHPAVKKSFQYQEGAMNREDLRKGFSWGGITWENYRGQVGGSKFFEDDEAFVVPEGTSYFSTNFAPADFLETVNTVGLPKYAKISVDEKLQRYADVHTQSNPLALCTRPRVVCKVTLGS